MLEDARAGLFSHVAVENAERFGRNDTVALTAIDELYELGMFYGKIGKIAAMPFLSILKAWTKKPKPILPT